MKKFNVPVPVIVVLVAMVAALLVVSIARGEDKSFLPEGSKLTGKLSYKKELGKMFLVSDSGYEKEEMKLVIPIVEGGLREVQRLLKSDHPAVKNLNLKEETPVVFFGGKKNKKYRAMIADIHIATNSENVLEKKVLVVEVFVEDEHPYRNEGEPFGHSVASVVVLGKEASQQIKRISSDNIRLLIHRETYEPLKKVRSTTP